MADFEIRTDSSSLEERRAVRRQKKQVQWIVVGTLVACLLCVGLLVATQMGGGSQAEVASPVVESPRPPLPDDDQALPDDPRAKPPTPTLVPESIPDDGQTMWRSPTAGEPIDLSHLPTGCQMIIAIRPAELLATGEGEKVLAALGPRGRAGIEFVERETGLRIREIERLLLGLRPGKDFAPEYVLVITPTPGIKASPKGKTYEPTSAGGTFVVATKKILEEVQELAGSPPLLRREMDALLSATDDQRHVTILVAPNFLFSEGRKMWGGEMAPLRDPLFALLPDSTRAAALSLHWSDDFFAEVRVSATIDHRPQDLARDFRRKVAGWPATAEQAMLGLSASPYSRTVVARLPAMLRALYRYVRVDRERKHALLRAYLPAPAGHNLLMAGELMLAEQYSGSTASGTPGGSIARAPDATPLTLQQRLEKPVSVRFSRDTLEMAVHLLSEEMGVEIKILGGDLQLDGITKNQSFALDEKNKPAEEILLKILRLANPDKTATGPADPKQKLVYVIDPKGPSILVTTRAAAAKRGDKVPGLFAN